MTNIEEMADRVSVARELKLGPMQSGELTEGEHYTVVAYTDWMDLFVPTVIRWKHSGEIDDLRDAERAHANAQAALR